MIEWLLTILCKDYLFRLMQLISIVVWMKNSLNEIACISYLTK